LSTPRTAEAIYHVLPEPSQTTALLAGAVCVFALAQRRRAD
jgi:hypothetical protein